MALLVYKFSDYEHTAEREQYRTLCKQLKAYYENRDEICIFIANYNLYDCELDGMIIKQDAIMAVEFKNFGGTITAVDNGHWKAKDGTIVKGGSRKSVYQQAKLNHIAIKNGLEEGNILPAKSLKNVAALVVFHQPTIFVNQLSQKTQSWLHVCDETSFMEKVQDITSTCLDLSKENMVELVHKMALDEDYLEEDYSNKDVLHEETDSDTNAAKVVEATPTAPAVQVLDEERQGLHDFVDRILQQVLKRDDCSIQVFYSRDAQPLFVSYGITLSHEYLVTVEAEGIGSSCQKLSRFMNHEVRAINPKLVYWEDGETINIEHQQEENAEAIEAQPTPTITQNPSKVAFRKSKTILPHWLDKKIFNDHNAIYAPNHERYEYNLNLKDEELKVYLGTYFPRSYAEMFCIVDNLMQNKAFADIIQSEEQISILDCGCGTGGEILGLITALAKHLPQVNVNVTAIDGNEGALAILNELVESNPSRNVHAQLTTLCQTFNSTEDMVKLANGKENYHFVLCDKMVCELISKQVLSNDAYAIMAKMIASHLHKNGLLIMLDVTTKDEHTGLFYPQLMNNSINEYVRKSRTIKTLLPLSCACNEGCKDLCFMQQTFCVSHSHKNTDESRVCYRVLCRKPLKEAILKGVNTKGAAHVIHPVKYNQNDESAICRQTKDNQTIIDSFNINL
ncbi:MAG: NERD domain-containing protein [Bacteroidales bacterium]|nr:NERD domain-containing protein [Candidatus Equimonas faecalis]